MALIRRIRPDDWQQYKALRIEAMRLHPEAFGSTYEGELAKSDEQWQARARECATSKDKLIIVADNECQLVGMAGLFRDSDKRAHIAHIQSVYVQSDFRGRDLGCALMQEALACARRMNGLRKISLHVSAVATPAYRLYRSCGFKEAGRLVQELCVDGAYYDLLVMELYL